MFEHSPTITELFKFASLDYRAMRMFVWEVEDALMNIKAERINTNTMYQKNEIIADAWDEYEACIDREVSYSRFIGFSGSTCPLCLDCSLILGISESGHLFSHLHCHRLFAPAMPMLCWYAPICSVCFYSMHTSNNS